MEWQRSIVSMEGQTSSLVIFYANACSRPWMVEIAESDEGDRVGAIKISAWKNSWDAYWICKSFTIRTEWTRNINILLKMLQVDVLVCFFLNSFTLYPAHSKVGECTQC